MGLEIAGTGIGLPNTLVLSSQLDTWLGRPVGWLEAQCGVHSRPRISGDETQISLAVIAAKAALSDACLDASEVDLVISACGIGYQPLPGTAPLLQRALGIGDGKAAAFDVNATCLSFVVALDIAATYFAAGKYKTALIVSADIASRSLPWEAQPDVAGLFGDGAAAFIVRKSDGHSGIVACAFKTFPSGYDACQIGAGGTRFDFHNDLARFSAHAYFAMNGRELFRLTSKHFGHFVTELLDKAGWHIDKVDIVIPHQASPFALKHMIRQCGFNPEIVMDITRTHGNEIAASIPIAFHVAAQNGRIPVGARVLLLGTSAGVSFGGMALVR